MRLAHRHPSNNLVIYTTTANQADRLREQGELWLSKFSANLTIKKPVCPVVVHRIPTSFNPTNPDHIRMLEAMNPDTFKTPPIFVKWISQQAVQRGASHSSIRIGFASAEQAKEAVETKVFYGRYNKRTEHGRAAKAKCMNCLQDSHTSRHCKENGMCPYCAKDHPADTCDLKGKLTSNCTACARHLKKNDKKIDLQALFSTTPASLHHSPLDPTCPTRIAKVVDKERQATAARAEAAASAKDKATATSVSTPQPAVATANTFSILQRESSTQHAASTTTGNPETGAPVGDEDNTMITAQ